MNKLNVMNERLSQHLLDRFREEAIEEERREYARKLSVEEVRE